MIYKIYANNSQFKEIEFTNGLNIIKAEEAKDSGDKDTRNGVGKSTLINIIHFCLGSNLDKKLKNIEEIKDWVFTIELDICNEKITASRAIDHQSIIKIIGNTDEFPIKPDQDPDDEFLFYTNKNWKELLGKCLFGLEKSGTTKYSPSYRSSISYFIRRRRTAYDDPFKQNPQQQTVDWKINTAFLLGLNWKPVSEDQELLNKEKSIKFLDTTIKEGLLPDRGELEVERINLEKEVTTEEDALSTFQVHPQYKKMEEDATKLTKEIHEISNELILLNLKLEKYEESISTEYFPEPKLLEDLYEEAGIIFPDNIKRSLEEANEFHNNIIRNRREFLQTEILELKMDISNFQDARNKKTNQRAIILDVLNKYGALEEYTLLQSRLAEKLQMLNEIKYKINEINRITVEKNQIKEQKIVLEAKFLRDYEESRPNWEKAVLLFNENSISLYNEQGFLLINVTDKGYTFEVDIQRDGSEGIDKMKIFCYDLMLVELQSQQEGNIDFLIHDSIIYDSVDTRQRALAIQLAHKKAIENNFQYICALNSDMIPYNSFSDDFDVEKFVRLSLTDNDPSDFLLGFEF